MFGCFERNDQEAWSATESWNFYVEQYLEKFINLKRNFLIRIHCPTMPSLRLAKKQESN